MALTAGASGEKNQLASSQQRQDQHLGQMWKQTVFETVARLACDNFFNSTIVSSCIFFFDQCEIEAVKPKVDLAVTNRLYHYREAANPKNRDQHQLALTTSSTISSTSRRPTNLRKELDWGCFHTLAM